MGNALRLLYTHFCKSTTTTGVSALAHDIFHFELTSQVPDGLSEHVVSSKKAQANWYRKLLDAWSEAKSPPKTPEEASRFVIHTLKRHQKADVEGLLAFYGLPLLHTLGQPSANSQAPLPDQGVKFELQTLPVDVKAVPDGDTITVYVSTTDPRESSNVPKDIKAAAAQRLKARADKNYTKVDALQKKFTDSGYRVLNLQNQEILARKYRIRLRGIDAPESSMPYGKEAKEELAKLVQGKCLRVLVYGEDRYGRCIGDIYCNGKFAQEIMLKKGLAWHYSAYDQSIELATVDGNTVPDGDGINVYVNTADPRESSRIPRDVLMAAVRRSKARAKKGYLENYTRADELCQKITESGYHVINLQNEEILARKYRIRLRGIDAPENAMPFGKEAKQELVKLVHGKCLRVLVYGVADVYCNGIFVQEVMLKKGLAWHYAAYDQRVELATWQKEARAKRLGFWAQLNPEKPWEWRKEKREGR